MKIGDILAIFQGSFGTNTDQFLKNVKYPENFENVSELLSAFIWRSNDFLKKFSGGVELFGSLPENNNYPGGLYLEAFCEGLKEVLQHFRECLEEVTVEIFRDPELGTNLIFILFFLFKIIFGAKFI